MKKILCIVLSIIIVVSALIGVKIFSTQNNYITQTFLERVKEDYELVWSDEFNSDTLDLKKWQIDADCRRNSELQYYTSSLDDKNLQLDGENLVFVPKIEEYVAKDGTKFKYTSAEISTQGRSAWKYGYFEFRAKLSCGENVVPAIWMMGMDYEYGGCYWPFSGEIDILEKSHNNNTIVSTLHHSPYGEKTHLRTPIGSQSLDHKLNEEFHNYWLYWTDKYMIVGVDDEMQNIVDITIPDLSQSFRNYEHWLILNVALGMHGLPVDDREENDWKMWVDYARVYQLKEDKLYDNYQTFDAINIKNNGKNNNTNITSFNNTDTLNFIMQDELKPGKYDVYAELGNSDLTTYINGKKTNKIKAVDHGKAIGNQAYVGSVDLQVESCFDISFKGTKSSKPTVEKLIFVKTDETKTTSVVVNKDSCVKLSDNFEVESENELEKALKYILPGGTIKLSKDIKITKNFEILKETILDLNGKTLKVSKGTLYVNENTEKLTIKNGNILIANGSSNFIYSRKANYISVANLVDVDVTIDSKKSGSLYDGYYSSVAPTCSNCTFTYTNRTKDSSPFRITSDDATFNNCTFNLNDRKAFLIKEGNILNLNSCVVNDASYLFYSNKALTYCDVVLANTKIKNVGALTNIEENAQYITIALNNVLKSKGQEISVAFDLSGDFTVTCEHSFVDGDCLIPNHCEYCYLADGVAPGHKIATETTPSDCVYKGNIRTYCEVCEETFSEKTIPILDHKYEYTKEFTPSCGKEGYHLWTCSECGELKKLSYNGDGKWSGLPHDYKETVKKNKGIIVYKCKNCSYSYTEKLEK